MFTEATGDARKESTFLEDIDALLHKIEESGIDIDAAKVRRAESQRAILEVVQRELSAIYRNTIMPFILSKLRFEDETDTQTLSLRNDLAILEDSIFSLQRPEKRLTDSQLELAGDLKKLLMPETAKVLKAIDPLSKGEKELVLFEEHITLTYRELDRVANLLLLIHDRITKLSPKAMAEKPRPAHTS